MSRRQLFTGTFLLVFLLLLWELGLILRPFFSPILWAVILATTTYPLYVRLLARVGERKNVAAGIMTGGMLLTAVLPAVYAMILASQEGVEAYEQAAEWLKEGHLKDLGAVFAKIPGVGALSQELAGRLIVAGSGSVEASLLEGGKAISTFLLSQGVDFAKNALLLATDFLVMLFTLFFVFRDGPYAYNTVFRAIPLEEGHKVKIFERLNTTMRAVVTGTLLTALAQGVTAGVTYYLLGLPFSVFLGALSGLLSLLPVGGTTIVWVPAALYLLFSGAVAKGVILIGVGAGLVGLMDNLLQPLLVGGQARLPVLPLFLASFGGLAYFGVLGLFLGPILLAVVLETLVIYQEEYQQQSSGMIMEVTTAPREDLRTAHELADKTL
ncbi:MAG TPA: AI-2E family transporter [Nitrospiraceae bacterium]|jgi:predicted PurR-regulated permease PerM|nr:AI-2E family transporter [Nitrospiraceae bacterium]